jgi:hypothetical protein
MEEGCWKAETQFLEREGIRHLLGAPQIIDLGHWKEEATKFIVIDIMKDISGLTKPIVVTGGLIHRITGILKAGVKVPKTTNANDWMQFLTGMTTTKNSKGLLINKILDMCMPDGLQSLYLCVLHQQVRHLM